jgi:hypothetical protein
LLIALAYFMARVLMRTMGGALIQVV